MHTKFLLKITAVLIVSIFLIAMVDLVILQGGVFVERLSATPPRARLAAQERENAIPESNIKVKKLKIAKKSNGLFRKGESVDISCAIQNDSKEAVKNFHALIRIPGKDIVNQQVKSLKPDESLTLKGSLLLENSGILYMACRTDMDHEIAALYVLPS